MSVCTTCGKHNHEFLGHRCTDINWRARAETAERELANRELELDAMCANFDSCRVAHKVLQAERDALRAQLAESEAAREKAEALHLGRTPDGTRLAYLHGGEVIVPGWPTEGDGHSCDEMGCGSVGQHVVRRVDIDALRAELERAREALRNLEQCIGWNDSTRAWHCCQGDRIMDALRTARAALAPTSSLAGKDAAREEGGGNE